MSNKSSTRRGVLVGAGLVAAQSRWAAAQSPAPAFAASPVAAPNTVPSTTRANSGTVGVISGGVDGTYIRIAADLASVLDDGDRLRVLPMIGKGSVQNISDIIYLRGIDVGIVQSDALAFVLRQNLFPGVTQAINYITKLYDEEVHVLARRDITSVEDLKGKAVNIDVRGSGTAMTASLIFSTLSIPIEPTYNSQNVALKQLQDGDIAALVYVAGMPASLFASVRPGSGLHFLSLPLAPALLGTYLPTQLAHGAYPSLVPEDSPVDTLAVGAVMAVYGWQPGSERHTKVMRFVAALSDKFALLQQPPRHAKWREVNLNAQVPGWTRLASIAVSAPSTNDRGVPILRR